MWNLKSRAALSEGLELAERLCTEVVMVERGTDKVPFWAFKPVCEC